MPRSKRVRIAEGVYRDKAGVAIVATVRGLRREQRLPPSTVKEAAQQARRNPIRTLEDTAPESATHGTLAADVNAYLAKLKDSRAKSDRGDLLRPWVTALGANALSVITHAQLVNALMEWERGGIAPNTRNKRLSALRVLWRTVTTDPDKLHPCERIKLARIPPPARNRGRPLPLVRFVLDHVGPSYRDGGGDYCYVGLQLEALAWIGHPSSTLARIRPEHVRWTVTPPQLYLQPRRKGKGVEGRWIDLTDAGADALKAWLTSPHSGQPWNSSAIKHAFRQAVRYARATLIAEHRHAEAELLMGMRVYDLRHSFLTEMAVQCGDIYAVSEYAQHSDIATTLIYMSGASSTRVRSAVAALSQVMPKTPPQSPGKVVTFRRQSVPRNGATRSS